MNFTDLQLIEPILRAVREEGYETPTPIQQQAIPLVLAGNDLLGVAQTGTGKTAAFAIPMIQILSESLREQRRPKAISALILTPTRELAIQIAESFANYGRHTGLRHTVIFGGVGQRPQTDALHRGIDILVATPGRLLDLMSQGFVSLANLKIFVLDEADRMLDMGFVHDVKKIITKLPAQRQTLFFSATMPPEIVKLSESILTNPEKVEVTPASTTADTVTQSLYFVDKEGKKGLLPHLINSLKIQTALVFTRTKHGADKVVKDLVRHNISAAAIHGNKGQNARQTALQNFKDRKIKVLVATDIAARGIDVDDLGHVFNYELPNIAETYVHRIGRTGRAGAFGTAFSFCDQEEKEYLRDIQKLIGKVIPVVEEHPFPMGNGQHDVPLAPPKSIQKTPQKNQNQPAPKPKHPNQRTNQPQKPRLESDFSEQNQPQNQRPAPKPAAPQVRKPAPNPDRAPQNSSRGEQKPFAREQPARPEFSRRNNGKPPEDPRKAGKMARNAMDTLAEDPGSFFKNRQSTTTEKARNQSEIYRSESRPNIEKRAEPNSNEPKKQKKRWHGGRNG